MTFGQYIENPMGKANAVFAARDAYKAEYMEKFDAIYMREAGKIDRYLYYDKAHDAYFAHFKMPSETVKGFYYDVVIRFYTNDNAERVNSSLRNYEVQFFSNDPAFIYTYLYVFRKLKMLIDDLTNKCPRASLTQAPEQRNAYEVPGYVKSIYFAYADIATILYSSVCTDKQNIENHVYRSILYGIPYNISSGELPELDNLGENVKCSIMLDIEILDTISKIITLMVTSNQCLLQAPTLNTY